MISVLIPTKNEQLNLPDCLRSVAWSDDIHVYDSDSTDETVEIALKADAKVSKPPWTCGSAMYNGDESEHRNWALRNIQFKYDWVLHVDADERVTPDLLESLWAAIRNPGNNVAYMIQRRDFFRGTWLKHVQTTAFYMRLFKPDKMHYERLVNPVSIANGPVGQLRGYLDHFPFSKGLHHWLARHNSYSTLEARQITINRANRNSFSLAKALFCKELSERRFHQKELFYLLPARPLMKFLVTYVGKRGFLDGRAGFTYAVLQSFYEYMIVLKQRTENDNH